MWLLAPKTILIKKCRCKCSGSTDNAIWGCYRTQCMMKRYMTQGFHRCGYSETLTVFPRAIPCDLFPRNLLASRRICKALKLAYRCLFIRKIFATNLQKILLLTQCNITILGSRQLWTLVISWWQTIHGTEWKEKNTEDRKKKCYWECKVLLSSINTEIYSFWELLELHTIIYCHFAGCN